MRSSSHKFTKRVSETWIFRKTDSTMKNLVGPSSAGEFRLNNEMRELVPEKILDPKPSEKSHVGLTPEDVNLFEIARIITSSLVSVIRVKLVGGAYWSSWKIFHETLEKVWPKFIPFSFTCLEDSLPDYLYFIGKTDFFVYCFPCSFH